MSLNINSMQDAVSSRLSLCKSVVKVDGTWKGQSSGAGTKTEWDLPREGMEGKRQLKISRDRFTVHKTRLLQCHLQRVFPRAWGEIISHFGIQCELLRKSIARVDAEDDI